MRRPRIFWGWYMVAASVALAAYNSGMFVYGFTAFINPIEATFGWSRAQISLATSLLGLESGTMAPFLGMAVDRWPARRLVLVGVVVWGCGAVWISQALRVVHPELRDPCSMVYGHGAVAGEHQGHVQPPDLLQTGEIGGEGVLQIGPPGDVGGDVEEDVIAGHQDLPVRFVEAHVARRVPGGSDAAKPVRPDRERLAVGQGRELDPSLRAVEVPGVVLERPLQLLPRETVRDVEVEEAPKPRLAVVLPLLDDAGLGLAEVHPGALGGELADLAEVVGVEVSHEEVGLREIHLQSLEGREHGLAALVAVHPRVDDQGPLRPAHEVRVEILQRVPGEGDLDPEDVGKDLLYHRSAPPSSRCRSRRPVGRVPGSAGLALRFSVPQARGTELHESGRDLLPIWTVG